MGAVHGRRVRRVPAPCRWVMGGGECVVGGQAPAAETFSPSLLPADPLLFTAVLHRAAPCHILLIDPNCSDPSRSITCANVCAKLALPAMLRIRHWVAEC